MAYANPAEFEVVDELKRSNQRANPAEFEVMDEQPAPTGEPTITNDPFAAFNATLKGAPVAARMPEITLPSQPVGANVTTPIQPVPQVTEAGLPVAKEVPSHGVYATETPTVINNIREGKFDDATSLAMENVMGSKPLRFLFGPTERQKIAESVPVRKEDGSTAYEYKPASTDAVEHLGAWGAARRSIASLERGIPVTELDKAVEGEMYKEDPSDSTIKSIGKGIYNAIHRTTVSLSDPTMALIPESRLISGGFTLDMANSAKEQIQKGVESDTPQGAIEGLLGGVITLGMAGVSGTHTLKPTKADIVKHMDVVPDELLHEASKELKTSAPDVADAANSELMKRAADFGQELDATLKRLPGDVQEKVNGILQKQLSGEELTPNERATLLQVRSYASKIAEEQSNEEFTSGPKPPVAPTLPTVPAAPVETGGQSVSPRIEPAPVVDASQQGNSSALFAKAKAEAATQPLREAAAAAEETSPEVAQAAREQADLLEKRAQAQAEREKAKPTEPPGEESSPAATVDPATEGAAVKPVEQGTKIVGPALRVPGEKDAAVKGREGQKHSDLVREAQSSISDEHLGRVMDDFAAGKSATGFEHVFHDEKGNILSREEAAQRALDHGQISQEQFDKAMARTGEGNKGLHSEDLIEFQEKKKAAPNKPEFVLPKRAEAAGDKMVSVDISKFDQGFAKDLQYVGEGQEDVPGRRVGVEKYLETGKPVETPEVSISPDGKVTFINGRHRYAVLRDGGLKEMPVAMSEESIANARKNGLLKTDEPSPSTEPVPPQSEAPESPVSGNRTAADEAPTQEVPVGKSGTLLDKLESLLTEEESHSNNTSGTKVLYRAANKAEAKSGAHFSEEEADAREYQNNPGFGGGDLYRFRVANSRVAETPTLRELASKLEPLLNDNQREWADEQGGLERAMRDYGYGHVFHALENSFGPKGDKIDAVDLLAKDHDWIRFTDDFPEGAKTWRYIGDKTLSPEKSGSLQSAAQKRVTDIQRDIENNADAEPAWKRRRQKDLKEAQKALAKEQEASSGGTEDSFPPLPAEPTEKETWQKTRDEIKEEGGSLTKHRAQTRAAVERGEEVPLEVLESYSGYHWADKMRREKYEEQVSDSFLTKIIDSLKDENGNLHFDPLFIQSVGKPALRGAVKLIREAVDAGGLAKDVMADVLQYIKAHTDTFDEAKTREFFQPVIDEALGGKETPAEETAPPAEQPAPDKEIVPPIEPPTPEPPITDSRMTGENGESKTGTANAIVDRERQRRGEPPIFSEAKKALGTTWDEATKAFDDNKNVGVELVEELNKKPRAVTAKEEAIMLREKVDVMNDLAKATETAINESADPEDRVASRVRAAVLMDQLNAIDEATRKAGNEWGRTGRFRQMLAAEDYSLSRMLQKKQLAMGEKWEKMSPEEKQKVEKQVKAMSDRIASLEKQLADFEAGHAERVEDTRNAEADKAIQQMVSKAETPTDAYTRGVLEKIQAGLKSQADKARARIRERLGKASAGVDPVVVYDVAVIGAEKLFSTGLDFARWSSEMLSDLGESFKAYVSEDTFKQSQSINDKAIEKGAPKSVREKIKPKAPQTDAERQQNLVNRIAEKRKNGARDAIGGSIQQLAESFVRGGIREREPLIDAVHAAVKEALPDASRKDIRDAISGYGDYKKLSQDEAKVILRDLKGQMQQISKLEDMIQNKRLPVKTGVERREPSAEERQLLKEVNKIKKELGLESTDPTQLKGALDAAKTRARNRIEDLQRAIEKKEKIPKSEKALKEDAELRDLNQQKAALQDEYEAMFGKAKPTTEDVAAEKAQKGVDAAAAAVDRWDQILKGEMDRTPGAVKEPLTNLEEEMRAQADAMRKAADELRRQPKSEDAKRAAQEDAQIKALEKSLAEYERKLKAMDFSGKGKAHGRPEVERVAKVRDARDAAKKAYDDLKKAQIPKRTPDEIALAAYKARTKTRIEELNDRTKRGDFSKKVRKPVELDPEGVKLRADAARAKLEFDRASYRDKQKNMSKAEKVLDVIPKIARMNLLSNPITFAKLFAAALWRIGATPIQEVIGEGLGKLPYVSEVAARAPREGGLNTRAEAKALTESLTKGMRDAWQKATKGETELDLAYGKPSATPHTWMDIFGNFHGAMKAPAVRAEFARSFEKLSTSAAANGVDITEPAVQLRIGIEAYREAQRAIFQNDNRVVQIWNTAMRQLEQPSKVTGRVSLGNKALQSAAKTIFPIVKIPTNIVAEAFQYATGTVTGSARLAQAFRRGVETLKPEEADLIMRELKRGTFGAAVMLLGFFAAKSVGGFYQPGQRRKEDDVKPGTVRVGNITIPSYLLHNPMVEQLQVGATIGRVADSKLRKKDHETQGIPAGILASALGLVEEVPFATGAEQLHKLFTPNEREEYLGELARSRVEPQVIQWMAQQTDKETPFSPFDSPRQRKPEGLKEEMEVGIPGLRQNVPLRRKRSWR